MRFKGGTYVMWLDVLGFDKFLKDVATAHGLKDAGPVREDIIEAVNGLLKHYERSNSLKWEVGQKDAWLVYFEDPNVMFNFILELLNIHQIIDEYDIESVPFEIAIGWIDTPYKYLDIPYKRYSDEMIGLLKTNIVGDYKRYYKSKYGEKPKSTFILVEAKAYSNFPEEYRSSCKPIGGSKYEYYVIDPEDLTRSSDEIKMPMRKTNAEKIAGDKGGMYGKSIYGVDRYGVVPSVEPKIRTGWTVYDPVKRDFVFKPKCEASIRRWIEGHDLLSYWIAVCITNNSDIPINCFELEFETSNLLEIEGVYVEGYEERIPYRTKDSSKIGRIRYVITIPEELPISIPKRGSLRLFIDIHSNRCGQHYMIENSLIRTEDEKSSRLTDIDFYYSCELSNIREDREILKEDYAKGIVDSTLFYSLKDLVKDIDRVIQCYWSIVKLVQAGERNAMTYVELLKKLEDLAGNTKFYYKTIYDCFSIAFSRDPNGKQLGAVEKIPKPRSSSIQTNPKNYL